LQRLDEEIRDANQRAISFIEYKMRAPKQLDKLLTRALQATNQLDEDHVALPAASGFRHAGPELLAKPRIMAKPAVATAVEKRPPTLQELAMEQLRKRMADNRLVDRVKLANYVVRHLRDRAAVTSDELTIDSINDLCCYQRLLLIAAHGACPPSQRRSDPQLQMLKGVRIDFLPEGTTCNPYLEHPRFHIQRERTR
jgi:phosphoenolpyruvate-protein kinase (PTS system EI component)